MKIFVRFLLLCTLYATSLMHAKTAAWTVLIHMETDTRLSQWALENINAMAQAGSTKNMNILVQLHARGDYLWRYKIKAKKIVQKDHVLIQEHSGKDIVDGMRWATKNFPAHNYGLILWDHGFGVLDPKVVQDSQTGLFDWEAEPDATNHNCPNNICPLRLPHYVKNSHHARFHRGIMLDPKNSRSYMTNNIMVETLHTILHDVLKGKKLGFIGTDACKMAMVEIAYQIKEYAEYFIGAQNCEIADGWPYQSIFERIGAADLDPQEIACIIVQEFERYCQVHAPEGLYTQSAIDLSHMDTIRDTLNSFVLSAQNYAQYNPSAFQNLVYRARQRSVAICTAPFYTDFVSFFERLVDELFNESEAACTNKEVLEQTMPQPEKKPKKTPEKVFENNEEENTSEYEEFLFNYTTDISESLDENFITTEESSIEIIIQDMIENLAQTHELERIEVQVAREELIEQARQTIAEIRNAVVTNATGAHISQAEGLSVYFPYNHVESSYPTTRFAKESLWLDFLINTLGCN